MDTTCKHDILADLGDLGFRAISFLSDCSFKVRVGSTLSELREQEMGVPQGSILFSIKINNIVKAVLNGMDYILSLALFSIKINNIVKAILKGTDCFLFVDIFALCVSGKTLNRVERAMQLCVNSVHVHIKGNSVADSAAKDALAGDTSVELIPFSGLKSWANKYILELWQSEWDEFPENKLHISSFERVCCLSLDKQKRRICDSPIAHWPFFYSSFLFIEGWRTANVHQMRCAFNYWTYFTYLFRSYLNKREPHACVVSGDSPEKILIFLKEINIFEKN